VAVASLSECAGNDDEHVGIMAAGHETLHAVQRIALAIAFGFGRDIQRRKVRRLIKRQREGCFTRRDLWQPFSLQRLVAAKLDG